MATKKEGSKDVTYGVVEESDYETISIMTDSEGWNTSTEDVKYLCSFLPAAAKVARSGDKLLGVYHYDITAEVWTIFLATDHQIIISSREIKYRIS